MIRSQSEHASQNLKLGIKKVALKSSILSLFWIPLFQKPNWRIQNGGKKKEFILSFTTKQKSNVMYNSADEEQKFKQAIRDINPQMGLAQIVTLGSKTHLKAAKYEI